MKRKCAVMRDKKKKKAVGISEFEFHSTGNIIATIKTAL